MIRSAHSPPTRSSFFPLQQPFLFHLSLFLLFPFNLISSHTLISFSLYKIAWPWTFASYTTRVRERVASRRDSQFHYMLSLLQDHLWAFGAKCLLSAAGNNNWRCIRIVIDSFVTTIVTIPRVTPLCVWMPDFETISLCLNQYSISNLGVCLFANGTWRIRALITITAEAAQQCARDKSIWTSLF